jgi:F-type H+-transporting ATPase subunit b
MEILADAETWVAVAFIIFFVLFGKKLVGGINGRLDERSARIKADLDEARRLREAAESLLAEYQTRQRAALHETTQILAHARDEAETLKKEAATNLAATLKRRERMALDKIAQAEAQAVAEVRNLAVDLAVAAAHRILDRQMAGPQSGKLIDQAIAEIDKKLH